MLKSFVALITALFAGLLVAGSATSANAGYRHHNCCGGPVPPSYVYHTVHKVSHVTRYHDVSRTRYVYRPHRIVHVTRVQPIVYVHNVKRVHYHTVAVVRPYHVHETEYLPVRYYNSYSVSTTYDCVCSYHHCH